MIRKLTRILMAGLMAVPMCWCCIAQAMAPVAEEVSCPACLAAADSTQAPAPLPDRQSHDCACCLGLVVRDQPADAVGAPRTAFLAEAVMGADSEWLARVRPALTASLLPRPEHGPPPLAAPLYLRNRALLI